MPAGRDRKTAADKGIHPTIGVSMRVRTLFTTALVAALTGAVPASVALANAPASGLKPAAASVQGVSKSVQPIRTSNGTGTSTTNVIYNVGCWTTFIPNAPHGAPMTQYYANCSSAWVIVCPAVDVNGVRIVYGGLWALLAPYTGMADDTDTTFWSYSATIPNGNYTTVFC
jgi:hypothetical protein